MTKVFCEIRSCPMYNSGECKAEELVLSRVVEGDTILVVCRTFKLRKRFRPRNRYKSKRLI